MTKYTKQDQQEARETLERMMPKGSTVYTILDSASASGMSRRIRLVVFKDGTELHPNWSAAVILGRTLKRGLCGSDCIVCKGCGMDMGFELVYSLSQALYGDGYALNHRWL
jgi:hypothetical protein